MRIATLNLWHRHGPWERRQQRIVDHLGRINADILLLQEVWTGQAVYLARLLRYPYYYSISHEKVCIEDETELCGNAILSKHPIENIQEIILPHSPNGCDLDLVQDTDDSSSTNSTSASDSGSCCAIICTIKDVTVCCTHLSWRLSAVEIRKQQIQAILEKINPGPPIIFGGDFNMIPHQTEYLMMISEGFVDTGQNDNTPTWDNRNVYAYPIKEEDKRLDYIFLKNIAGLYSYSVYKEDPKKPMSDHFCVVVDISLSPPSSPTTSD